MPLGSTFHYFPGGKEQPWVSGRVERMLARAGEGGGTPAAAASPATAVFKSWQAVLVPMLQQDGIEAARAERLAWLIVGGLEGAVVMARSQRSPVPLEAAAEELRALIQSAITT